MTQQIPVRIEDDKAAAVDQLVEKGLYASRSDVLRSGLDRLLDEEREREIEAAYRRAHEQEAAGATAEDGLAALDAWSKREGGLPL
jgi:Arc/MetJ-type ribon-helix-helix transcriptional regulator